MFKTIIHAVQSRECEDRHKELEAKKESEAKAEYNGGKVEAQAAKPMRLMEIVAKVRKFIQELGPDFCFINVKKRFVVGESEFFFDLVFYHRTLKCMVAVELKKCAFKPAYLGQLDFYLACLDKYVKLLDENPSIGLILCHSMDRPVVELAVRRYAMPMGVATYGTSEDVP